MNSQNKIQKWTPLHTRIIASRIGDGTLNFYNKVVWDNKKINEMVSLLKQLNISHWKPIIGDRYGTYKLILPSHLFKEFSRIFNKDYNKLITSKVYFLDCIKELDNSHKLQALCSFIFDDGSFVNWRPVIFEDQDKEVVLNVKEIWDSLFPKTSKMDYIVTKKGTKVYHLFSNRDGVIKITNEIKEAKRKFGHLADLWHKQETLEKRFKKATNKRAIILNETKTSKLGWKNKLLEELKKNNELTFNQIKDILYLSQDRTRTLVKNLLNNQDICLIKAGNRSRYSLKEKDISQQRREKLILRFLKENRVITTKCACHLLDLGKSHSYKILKKMVNKGILEQKWQYYLLKGFNPNAALTKPLKRGSGFNGRELKQG